MTRVLGIDIDRHSIKAALVQTAMRKSETLCYAEAKLSGDNPEQAMLEAVTQMQATLGHRYDAVIACLGGQDVSFRVLQLPRAASRHLHQIIPNELESLLPFDMADVLFDHQPISQTPQTVRLLTAATPRQSVVAELQRLKNLNMQAQELAVGAAAFDGLGGSVAELREAGPLMLISLDLDSTDICVLRQGTCELARTLSIGVSKLPGQADALGREITQTLAGYRGSGGELPTAVYLVGEGSIAPGAVRWMSELLHVDVDVLELPNAPGVEPAQRPRFARALALASRTVVRRKRLNLRAGDFAPDRTLNLLREKSKLLAWCGAALFVAFVVSSYGRYQLLGKQRDALQLRLGRATQELFGEEAKTAERARALLEGKDGDEDPLPRVSAYDILEAVSRAVPDSIVHDTKELRIEIGLGGDRGRLDLEGVLSNNNQRAQVANNLRQHDCIKELKEAGTSPAGDGRLRYEIEAVLECAGQTSAKKKKSSPGKDNDGLE
jgi:general secretion pathway protein L